MTAKTRAQAAAAVASWEELRAKAKGKKVAKDAKRAVKATHVDGNEYVFLCVGSFNVDAVRTAWYQQQKNAGMGMSTPFIEEMWSDYLIVSANGSCQRVAYTVDPDTQKVSFGVPQTVVSTWLPADANGLPIVPSGNDDDDDGSDIDVQAWVAAPNAGASAPVSTGGVVAMSGSAGKIVALSHSNQETSVDRILKLTR